MIIFLMDSILKPKSYYVRFGFEKHLSIIKSLVSHWCLYYIIFIDKKQKGDVEGAFRTLCHMLEGSIGKNKFKHSYDNI